MLRTASNLALPQTLAEIVDPSRSALLVYDMQVGITRQVKDAPRIVKCHQHPHWEGQGERASDCLFTSPLCSASLAGRHCDAYGHELAKAARSDKCGVAVRPG